MGVINDQRTHGGDRSARLSAEREVLFLRCLDAIPEPHQSSQQSPESMIRRTLELVSEIFRAEDGCIVRIVYEGRAFGPSPPPERPKHRIREYLHGHQRAVGQLEVLRRASDSPLDAPFDPLEKEFIQRAADRLERSLEHHLEIERESVERTSLRLQARQARLQECELQCLYELMEIVGSEGRSLEGILTQAVRALPAAEPQRGSWAARIIFDDKAYHSPNYRSSSYAVSRDIHVFAEPRGKVELLRTKPGAGDGEIDLAEFGRLLDGVSGLLGRAAERLINTEQLREDQVALRAKTVALRETMATIDGERDAIARCMARNVEQYLLPMVEALRERLRSADQRYLDIIAEGLDDLTSPWTDTLARRIDGLTPTELRICRHIRQGLASKEIAQLEGVSPATIRKHREHIRKKLGLQNRRMNLAVALSEMMNIKDDSDLAKSTA